MPNEELDKAKHLLTTIYIKIKNSKKSSIQFDEDILEKEKLIKNLSIIEMIYFIENYINSLLNKKNKDNDSIEEERKENDDKPLYKQYEELLIKAENDIRKHIKVSIYNNSNLIIMYIGRTRIKN
jgi:hypothetical protein